jgi:hypothetical protein
MPIFVMLIGPQHTIESVSNHDGSIIVQEQYKDLVHAL